jgi:glycerate dehydrogenase
MRIVLLDSFTADQGEAQAWPELARAGDVVLHPRTGPAQLAERCAGAEALITNKVVLPASLLSALPALRYVGVCATGTNVVDLDAARARGLAVTNVPGYAAESVAQLVFAIVLHLASDVAGHDAAVKAGAWAASPDFAFFLRPLRELHGKTLLVVGLGAIGRAVARIGRGFGLTVLAAAVPGSPTHGDDPGAQPRLPLDEALPRADVVSLHCPLTPATERLVNERFLARLRPGAILVNTSRGGLIDEPALVAALRAGHLGGVGLDVLSREPPPADHPLADPRAPYAARVVVTPHLAWGTVEARARLRREVGENLLAYLRGEHRNRVA